MEKTTLFILFLCGLLNGVAQSEKSLTFSLWVNCDGEQSSIHFTIGNRNPKDYARLYLDLSANISSLNEGKDYNISSVNPTKSQDKTFEETGSVTIHDTLCSIDQPDIRVPNFTFALNQNDDEKKREYLYLEGRIALSRSSDSFLNQLIRQGKVSKRILSVSAWEVCLGENKGGALIHKAPLIDYRNQWATTISSLIIGKITNLTSNTTNHLDMSESKLIHFNLPLILDTYSTINMVFPYSYADEFRNLFFSELIEKDKCVMNQSPEEISFHCDSGVFSDVFAYLLIDNILIELNKEDLELLSYRALKKPYLFPISFRKDSGVAVLGRRFVKRFKVVLNEEDRTIGFSHFIPSYLVETNRSTNEEINKDGVSLYKYVSVIAIVIVLLGIVQVFYTKSFVEMTKNA